MIHRFTYILCLIFLFTFLSPAFGEKKVNIEHFTEEDGFSQSIVTNVIQDSIGYIWISSWDGLIRYDGYRFKSYKAQPGDRCPLETNRIDALCEADSGRILCKSAEKFYYFIRQTGEFIPSARTFSSKRPSINPSTTKWIQNLPIFNGISIRILFIDNQGGIWVTSNRGLDRISTIDYIPSPSQTETQEKPVRGIYEDKAHRIWISDKRGYVCILSPNKEKTRYLSPSGKLHDRPIPFGANVYSILQDREGSFWLGCKPGGLYRLSPQNDNNFNIEHYSTHPENPYSLSHDEVYSIVEDKHGRLWIGTYGGGVNLVEKDKKNAIRFIHPGNCLTEYPSTALSVYCLYAHSKDVLLIGTTNGLYTCSTQPKKTPEEIEFHTFQRNPNNAKSLSNNRILDIATDHEENVYIATYGGGLNRIEKSSLHNDSLSLNCYTMRDGLASDIIIALARDNQGNIWCSSESALSCFHPKDATATNYMRGFFSDGFSFVESAFICLPDNTLLAGTTQGLLTLETGKMKKSRFVPPIAIEAPNKISLSPDEQTLTIHFAALDYNKRVAIQYAYRFGNKESKWSYTTDNHINLSNIPAGSSTLHIRSTNGDGVWVKNEQTIEIHRTPHFNERPIAWMLYGGILLIIVGLVIKTGRYIFYLKKELNDIRLTTGETIEYLTTKLQESLEKKVTNSKPQPTTDVHKDITPPLVELPETDNERFRKRVEAFVMTNLSNPDLGIEDFARETGVSRSALYLQMKRVFDCTPNNYLQEVRMTHAKRMFENGHTNISDVAYNCGYSDPKYFSRCFKKTVGQTPTDYIAQVNKEF